MQSLRNLEDVTTAFDSNASQIDRKRKTCSGGSLGKSSSHTSKRCKTLSKDILLRTTSEFPQGRVSEHLQSFLGRVVVKEENYDCESKMSSV